MDLKNIIRITLLFIVLFATVADIVYGMDDIIIEQVEETESEKEAGDKEKKDSNKEKFFESYAVHMLQIGDQVSSQFKYFRSFRKVYLPCQIIPPEFI